MKNRSQYDHEVIKRIARVLIKQGYPVSKVTYLTGMNLDFIERLKGDLDNVTG